MKIINKEVNHTSFGKGKVLSQEAEKLSVQFSEKYGIKQFGFPDVFEKHLAFSDAAMEIAVLKELNFKQANVKAEKERKYQQYEESKIIEKLEMAELKKKKAKKAKI